MCITWTFILFAGTEIIPRSFPPSYGEQVLEAAPGWGIKGSHIAVIVLVAIVVIVVPILVFVCFFQKKIFGKTGKGGNQADQIRLPEGNISQSLTLMPMDPESPSQTPDGTVRTFSYPSQNPRGRMSSVGSTNSTTPLIRYRNGSYRSRLSSTVSSRLDSNITEGKHFLHNWQRTTAIIL